jgi:hypothetical protein
MIRIGEVGVRGAQLCKGGKTGAASIVVVWVRNMKSGPARVNRGCGGHLVAEEPLQPANTVVTILWA